MRYHHNELNYKRGQISADDWSFEEIQEHEDVSRYDDIENFEEQSSNFRPSVRRRIDDYLEQKRTRETDVDPFDEDYYYEDE